MVDPARLQPTDSLQVLLTLPLPRGAPRLRTGALSRMRSRWPSSKRCLPRCESLPSSLPLSSLFARLSKTPLPPRLTTSFAPTPLQAPTVTRLVARRLGHHRRSGRFSKRSTSMPFPRRGREWASAPCSQRQVSGAGSFFGVAQAFPDHRQFFVCHAISINLSHQRFLTFIIVPLNRLPVQECDVARNTSRRRA